jgi:hypothetical protein
MGTRSLTIFKDEYSNKEIVVMYRQMDGYPQGHGLELWEKFGDFVIGNGIRLGVDNSKFANGMSCFAAQVVAYFKEGAGGFYLHPAGTRNMDEEYIYTFFVREGELWLSLVDVNDNGALMFNSPFKEYQHWLSCEFG